MSEVVPCPTCGAPAEASRTQTRASGEPVLTALTDAALAEKIAQQREVIRLQKDQLDAAQQRVHDLEEMLRFRGSPRPGVQPPAAPPAVPPGFPGSPFQGKAGAF